MDKGFIKLNRKSFAHKFWTKARVLSEFEAWIDLIQSTRYDETVKIEYIDGREIKYGRGQYPASIRFLAKKWSWGEQKVRSFLSELKRDGSITTDSSQGMNIITLCKFDIYNSGANAENTGNNTPANTDISFILNELQSLKTHLVTQQITQLQHSDNTNNKNYISIYLKGENRFVFESLNPLMEEFLNDPVIIEDFQRTIGSPYPSPDTVKELIKEFFVKLTVDGETSKDRKSAIYHFKSWYRQELESKNKHKPNEKPQKTGTAAGFKQFR